MNCINHPETPVAAYCQNCGKPLCSACVRQVANVTYCEPCLAARLGMPTPGAATGSAAYPAGAGDTGQFQYGAAGPLPIPDSGPNPALATLLGFIPGVGAMYNGQFIKALVHVMVFVFLIILTNEGSGFFGFFIPAWILYQVFDAHHTAKARRDGMLPPDPFGLNDIGVRLGIQTPQQAQNYPPGTYPPGNYPPGTYPPPASGAQYVPPAGTTVGPDGNPVYTAVPPVSETYASYDPAVPPPPPAHPEPIGAIILIALGVLFLLGTMNIFHFSWISHSWPLILIGLGIWIFIKRQRELPPGGGL